LILYDNDIILLDDLIYKIYTIPDLDQMRHTFLDLIAMLIPCNPLTFALSDGKKYMKDPILIGIPKECSAEYSDELSDIDYIKWIFCSPQNRACRMTDFYPEGVREQLPYYQKAYKKYNIHYEAILSLAYNNKLMGVVSLYRKKNEENFSDRDIYILNLLKNHLAYRLYSELPADESFSREKWVRTIDKLSSDFELTNRESEILNLMAHDEQSQSICGELFISMSTLRKHTMNIYRKLGISNRVELHKLLVAQTDTGKQ